MLLIDTVAIEHRYAHPLVAEYVQLFKWRTLYNPHNRSIRGYIQEGKKNSHLPTLTYMVRENGFWYLRAEVCLSKWLNRSNVRALSFEDLSFALGELSAYVSKLSGANFDAQRGNIARVDFIEDRWIDESKIIPFFKRARDVSLQTMHRITYEDTTIYFNPRSEDKYKVIKIYSKLHEVLDKKGSPEEIEIAGGQIRLEILLRTRAINSVIKELELSSREAREVLTSRVAGYVLDKEKRKLNYDDLFTEEKDSLQMLLESSEVKSIFGIYGFLGMYKRLGKNFYKLPFSKCPKRTYQDYLSKCRKLKLLP